PMMVENNTSAYGTGFTVTIEAADGVSTGVSAADRLTTVRAAIADAASRISSATPRLDAELLMAHALGVSHQDLLLKHLSAPAPASLDALIERRVNHEPVAYITGSRG
ncbi:3,4-dihydroxy-2-butanone-4-phosphate synthase, partial [Mycobacterium tuberculosis]|nr:3,4-dihydroxy-2-butanone-4-phosphate synthase [Mycobacterium tuberculosis]